jgi:hypothetical protein
MKKITVIHSPFQSHKLNYPHHFKPSILKFAIMKLAFNSAAAITGLLLTHLASATMLGQREGETT